MSLIAAQFSKQWTPILPTCKVNLGCVRSFFTSLRMFRSWITFREYLASHHLSIEQSNATTFLGSFKKESFGDILASFYTAPIISDNHQLHLSVQRNISKCEQKRNPSGHSSWIFFNLFLRVMNVVSTLI